MYPNALLSIVVGHFIRKKSATKSLLPIHYTTKAKEGVSKQIVFFVCFEDAQCVCVCVCVSVCINYCYLSLVKLTNYINQ